MYSRFSSMLVTALLLIALSGCSDRDSAPNDPADLLRVCADPNNMPFSNRAGDGFENRLAEMVAADLGRTVSYTWWPQRRGFIRNTLRAGTCDVVMGIPSSFELALPTGPYYRSTYVFVSRRDQGLDVSSLDDPRLKTLRIGVHAIGDDYANTPPAHALSRRGVIENVRGFSIYGDYSRPDPPADIIRAVVEGEIDLAIVWGPLGGYFAAHAPVPMTVTPVTPQVDIPFLPFVFDISMGVRRGEDSLRVRLDSVLNRHRSEIDRLLAEYRVPVVRSPRGPLGQRLR